MAGTISSVSNTTATNAIPAGSKTGPTLQRAREAAKQAVADAAEQASAQRHAQLTPAQVTRRIEQAGQAQQAGRVQQQDFVTRMELAAKAALNRGHAQAGAIINTSA